MCDIHIYVNTPSIIVQYANNVEVMPFGNIRLQYSFRTARSTVRHPAPSDRTTVPRPRHTSFFGVPGDITADGSQLGEPGA